MPLSDRDYVRGEHPPTCTCKECTERRLGKVLSQNPDKRRKDSQRTKPVILRTITPPRFLRRMWRKIPLSIHKLILSLLIIAGLVDIIRRGYTLFIHQTDPLKNTIIFLLEVGLWIWIVSILRSRRYKYRNPKFKLVFIAVIAITLVCTFAGIEPLSSYKDNIFDSVSDYLEEQRTIREVAEIAEAEKLAVEETARIKAEAEEKSQELFELEHQVLALVNTFRVERGTNTLVWSEKLHTYAREHSQAMATEGRLFHTPMERPYAENAWGGEGSTHWGADDIVESWLSSPMHRTWLLCPHLKNIAVGIAISETGMYASWTFWRNETLEQDWWYVDNTLPPAWWNLDWKAAGEKGITAITYEPHGTYTATVFGLEYKVIFEDKIMTFYGQIEGKRIAEYSFSKGFIHLKDVATGETYTEPFEYVSEYDCFTWNSITYYKQ